MDILSRWQMGFDFYFEGKIALCPCCPSFIPMIIIVYYSVNTLVKPTTRGLAIRYIHNTLVLPHNCLNNSISNGTDGSLLQKDMNMTVFHFREVSWCFPA